MSAANPNDDRQVVVVTGGGAGIGAAIAEELGRRGAFVVTLDPLVSLDGAEQLPVPEETTAGRIVAAGGSARASSASVTDADAVRALFAELVSEHGRLDGVVNVAGISRPTGFAKGNDDDWRRVLTVHLDGYRNVLGAALPIMAAAAHGRIVGVTSGSGWRPADAGAYSCAKRAVAALTWQLGRVAPPGVVVNAMSPIAVTRMVTAALSRAGAGRRASGASGPSGASASGGLSLGSMPQPDEIGPFGAHLVDQVSWCSGQVFFAGGSEVALVERPRLLEVVSAEHLASLPSVLEAVTAGAFVLAEASQMSGGGSNPRFTAAFDASAAELPPSGVASCAVVTDRPDVRDGISAALDDRGVTVTAIDPGPVTGFAGAAGVLASAASEVDSFDAVVVALSGTRSARRAGDGWQEILAEHADIVEQIHTDAAWARATADLSERTAAPIRLITLTDAVTTGGRSRAQASAQLSRAARGATDDRVAAFAVSVETDAAGGGRSLGEVVAHLACSPAAAALAGAELAFDDGWFGLRSHPRPTGSIVLGAAETPGWLDGALRGIVEVGGDATR